MWVKSKVVIRVIIIILALGPGGPYITSMMQYYAVRTQCQEGKMSELYGQMLGMRQEIQKLYDGECGRCTHYELQ